MNAASLQSLKKFLKETFLLGLVISLPVFAWVRLIFFEIPFSITEETTTLFKVVMTGWIIMIALKGTFHTILALATQWKTLSLKPAMQPILKPILKPSWTFTTITILLLCSVLYACKG